MTFTRLNMMLAWLCFAIALFTYGTTVEPTVSFWDCGEFIAASYKLQVGHPPGAPLFLLIGRIFTLFASPENVAYIINFLSVLSSAFSILFLFMTISELAQKLIGRDQIEGNSDNQFKVLAASLVGALAYTWTDSFWFSAVEAEVYAMSSLFIAIVFWAMVKWDRIAHKPYANRWLVLISFVFGLSIGVHLMSLLAIPACVLIFYFNKYQTTRKGLISAVIIGAGILGVVQNVIIIQLIKFAGKIELLFVNDFGLPYNTGLILFGLLIMAGTAFGIRYTRQKNMPFANTLILCFMVIVIGFSSYGVILVRAAANTPLDENNPDNAFALISYLGREQYGSKDLVYGNHFNSPLDNREPYKDGKPAYYQDKENGVYAIADDRKNSIPNYADEFNTFFPRMGSQKGNHIGPYKNWSGFKGRPITYRTVQGETKVINKPTFGENLSFFFNYQIAHMIGRYFMWNFVGRQNDAQGHGNILDGRWVTGIDFIDSWRLGSRKNLPEVRENALAHNRYYALPLLLGLLGMFYYFKKDPKMAGVVFMLFFFTGMGIQLYLNDTPLQPRERDYVYVASFYAFCIFIAMSVLFLAEQIQKFAPKRVATAGALIVTFLAAPLLLVSQNWDDHDRSGRYTARDIAKDYLDSCDKDAILFTNGDNDTFPLWYVQEVEGYRTDVRVVNLTLASTDWFIDMIKRQAYEGKPVKLMMENDDYRQGTRDYLPVIDRNQNGVYVDVDRVVPFFLDDNQKVGLSNGEQSNYIPTKKFKVSVDKQKVTTNGTVQPKDADRVVNEITWEVKKTYLLKSELMMLDILAQNDWDRPIYFANTMPGDSYFGLQKYMQHEGFAYRLVPYITQSKTSGFGYLGEVNTDIMYEKMMNKFVYGGLENGSLFLEENNLRFVTNLRLNFARLAEALIKEDKKEKAKEVLRRNVEITCSGNAPIDVPLLRSIELMYQLEMFELGDKLVRTMAKDYEEEFYYLMAKKPEFRKGIQQQIQQSYGVMQQLDYVTNTTHKRDSLGAEIRATFTPMQQTFAAASAPVN